MSFSIFCPSCNAELEADDDSRGEVAECPECGEDVTIVPMAEPSLPLVSPRPPEPPKQTRQIKACKYCGEDILATAVKCKHCGEFLDGQQYQTETKANIKKKTETVGVGCLVQGLGLAVMPLGFFVAGVGLVVTIPLGIVMLLIGSSQAVCHVCSNCGTKLTSKGVKVCPSCAASFR